MKTIKQTYLINSSADKVWQVLTNMEQIEKWEGGPAKMDDKVGTEFSLWGGEIWGKNLEVVPNKKLVQDWWSKGEIKDKPSKVIFNLTEEDGKVKLELIQTDVPDEFEKDLDDGWRNFYLTPLKILLES